MNKMYMSVRSLHLRYPFIFPTVLYIRSKWVALKRAGSIQSIIRAWMGTISPLAFL